MTLYTVTDDYHGGVLEFESASDLALALAENSPDYIWSIISVADGDESMENMKMLLHFLTATIYNLANGEQMKIWGKTITRVQ